MCELYATTQPAKDLLSLLSFRDITQALQPKTQLTENELQAKSLCLDLLKKDDSCIDALYLLSLLAAAQRKLERCRELLQKILSLEPENPLALYALGRVFKELDQDLEALAVLRRLTRFHSDNAEAYFLMATVLAPTSSTADCIAAYERSLTINPDHPGALLGIGHALKAVGRREEAIIAYQRCITLRPDSGEPYQSLANLKNYRFSASMMEKMQEKVDSGKLSISSEINFLFALAKAHEDRQDFVSAWQLYTAGNSKKRSLVGYDSSRRQETLGRIRTAYNKEFFTLNKNCGVHSSSPIFILGMPRSGSTLIEQILASHSKIEATGELPHLRKMVNGLNENASDKYYPENVKYLKPGDFAALGKRYLELTTPDRQQDRPHFIDKMPANFWHVGLIQ
ncbi:MAG: sulfotransferase, partial [Halioglobus sp.]